jgi:LacI family transcriptional regulator
MITIKKIAELANVSPGTVDRIIHNRGQVTQENIDKVNVIIEKYGYKRNIFASNLAFNKKYKIAVFLPNHKDLEYWKFPIIGIEKAAKEYGNFGFSIDYFYYNYDSVSFKKSADKLLKYDYDGVLFAPIFHEESLLLLEQFQKKNTYVIMIDSDITEIPNKSYIGQNAYQSGILSGKLISIGLNTKSAKVLVIKITKEIEISSIYLQRIKGFYSFFDNQEDYKNLQFDEIRIKEFGDIELTKQMFEGVNAVFIPNSRAYLVADFIKENKIKGIKIVGYDLLERNVEHLNNDVISFLINQNPEEQGFLGISHLYKKLVLQEEINTENYMPLEIIVKENINVNNKN